MMAGECAVKPIASKSCAGSYFRFGVSTGAATCEPMLPASKRIAVGRRRGDAGAAERAAGAADVLDRHLVAERPAHVVGHDARDHVARPARRERHDDGDRPRRIALCRQFRRRGAECQHRNAEQSLQCHLTHHTILRSPLCVV